MRIYGTADADVADSVGIQSDPLDEEMSDKGNGKFGEIFYISRAIFSNVFFMHLAGLLKATRRFQ